MQNIHLDYLVLKNSRLCHIVVFSAALVKELTKLTDDPKIIKQCEWMFKAIENVIYLNKELPIYPEL